MGTTGKAMVAGVLLSLYCSVALAGCDISLFDRASPPAIRGGVSNPLVDFDYASDVDAIRGINYLWNYVRNRLIDRGIGIAWPKAGIAQSLWAPLPPGEIACKFDQVSEIRTDSDAPITYGTTDEKQSAQVYVPDGTKVGSTNSAVQTTYTGDDGKPVKVDVRLSTSRAGSTINFTVDHSPGLVIGIADLPRALTETQIESLAKSASAQGAGVEQATYFEYTKQDPRDALAHVFVKAPNETTRFLFISGLSAKIGFEAGSNVEKMLADVVILDEKSRRLLFATDMSLLVPGK